MLLTKFHIIWPSVSEEKLFQKLTNKKQELPKTAIFVNGSKWNEQFPQTLPTTFQSIQPSCFRVEDFQKSANQKKEWPVVAMFVNGSELNEQSLQRTFQGCFLPSFDSFGQAVSEEMFLEINQSETRIACGGHVCTSIGTELALFIENRPYMLPTKFRFIWLRGEDF